MCLSASIIIPIFNQYDSLKIVLKGFSKQKALRECYEIIVVDDGSDDGLEKESSESIRLYFDGNITLVHQGNKGRAAARNAGIKMASAKIIILCDGDRVPDASYVNEHISTHAQYSNADIIVLGCQYDYFGNKQSFETILSSTKNNTRLIRISDYYKRITSIYVNNKSSSNLSWLSFLVGNISISRGLFDQVGTFDEDFIEWGFEHFELGLRMQKCNACFIINSNAINYHLAHSRIPGFYKKMIESSSNILLEKHPYIDIDYMKKLLLTNINPLLNEKIFL